MNIQRFEVRTGSVVRGTFDDRGDAEQLALDIACNEFVEVEMRPIDMVAQMRSLLRKAGRVIAERKRAGIPVEKLIAQRNELRAALASMEPEGRVEVRRARHTGTVVGLYHKVMESDPELPWAIVCEEHGYLVCTKTREQGRSAMARPDDWCEDCQENVKAKP